MSAQKTAAKSKSKNDNEKYCNSCGNIIHKEAEICPKCGVRQHVANPVSSTVNGRQPKSKMTAGLLAILVGGLGIHKFYLGNPGIGIVYILFAWTLIPSLIALIEGIIYLTFSGTDADFTQRYSH